MHTIHLLRHAKSSWSDPTLEDHERPLAKRGRRDGKRIAKHLRRAGIEPSLVLCSSAVRTLETLELVRPALPDATVEVKDELYAASADRLLEGIWALPDDVDSVLLIGHNPGLQDLALMLARRGAERDRLEAKFPTAALATLDLVNPTWRGLAEGGAELAGFVVPKQLG